MVLCPLPDEAEHIAAEHLRAIEGIDVFCPRLRYRKATRRGKIWWVEPLFPGYVLAKFSIAEMERAVTFCQGVRGLVRFGSGIPAVPDSFVETLKQEVRARQGPSEEVFTVSPTIELGDEVEIAHGPLQGMRGTVIAVPSASERVKILLEFPRPAPGGGHGSVFDPPAKAANSLNSTRLLRDHVTRF